MLPAQQTRLQQSIEPILLDAGRWYVRFDPPTQKFEVVLIDRLDPITHLTASALFQDARPDSIKIGLDRLKAPADVGAVARSDND
jgi:hypothetical protein